MTNSVQRWAVRGVREKLDRIAQTPPLLAEGNFALA